MKTIELDITRELLDESREIVTRHPLMAGRSCIVALALQRQAGLQDARVGRYRAWGRLFVIKLPQPARTLIEQFDAWTNPAGAYGPRPRARRLRLRVGE